MILEPINGKRIAIVHDNFAQMGGAERVAEALHRTFPDADIFSTLVIAERLTPGMQTVPIRTTWMQRLPGKLRLFRHYFLLYPFAVEGMDLSDYDLVITSCFGYAKGIRRREGALHICYCHTPMRWVWRTDDYLAREGMSRLKSGVLRLLMKPLKAWEIRAARRPDAYVANSRVVAERLRLAFGVAAEVINPPIDTDRFTLDGATDDYYLVLARLVPYKRTELAVGACSALGRRLIVVGDGPDRARLQSVAGPTVTFAGRLSDVEVVKAVQRCRALLFPGEEDFGMVPLEVNAAGKPVIAYRGGGAEETVVEGKTGIFFDYPSADSLVEAIQRFETMQWDASLIRSHAEAHDLEGFQQRFLQTVNRVAPGIVRVRC